MPALWKTGTLLLAGAAFLAGCGSEPTSPRPLETEIPEDLQDQPAPVAVGEEAEGVTPLEERVATLGLLNKRNNVSQDVQLRPGESVRVGDVIVRLQSCERTAPWEFPRDTGAFVQLLVQERDSDDFATVFSGWLFKQSPSLNVVEHPVYDVWVKECAMIFPGEDPLPVAPSEPEAEPAPAASPAE